MTAWCIERLGRLPEELGVPYSALIRAMIADDVMAERTRKKQ